VEAAHQRAVPPAQVVLCRSKIGSVSRRPSDVEATSTGRTDVVDSCPLRSTDPIHEIKEYLPAGLAIRQLAPEQAARHVTVGAAGFGVPDDLFLRAANPDRRVQHADSRDAYAARPPQRGARQRWRRHDPPVCAPMPPAARGPCPTGPRLWCAALSFEANERAHRVGLADDLRELAVTCSPGLTSTRSSAAAASRAAATSIGPKPTRPIPVLLGGWSEKTLDRIARRAAGWLASLTPHDQVRASMARLRKKAE
jgi:hypothetical protein